MNNDYCIVFDLDGVLLDSESNLEWLEKAARDTLQEYDIPQTSENINKLYPGNIFQFNKMSRELGIDEEKIWKTRNKNYTFQKLSAIKNRMITPFYDIDELYRLKKTSKLCIISDSPQEVVDYFIKEFDFKNLFNKGIGRGTNLRDLDYLKPNPYSFERLLKHINCKKYFYIGDTENDRIFSKNTGMEFLLLSRGKKEDGSYGSLKDVVNYLLKIIN